MNEPRRNHGLRFSVRGLLLTIAFFAVACASLKFANDAWWIALSGIVLLLFMALAVIAFVGRGPMRAFAMGFTICGLFYGGLLYVFGDDELDPYAGGLPTTRIMLPVFQAVVVNTYLDGNGQPIPNYVPPTSENASVRGMGGGVYGGAYSGYGGFPSVSENPQRGVFMSIGHVFWAVIFGLAGGTFARFVYAKSARQTEPSEHSARHP